MRFLFYYPQINKVGKFNHMGDEKGFKVGASENYIKYIHVIVIIIITTTTTTTTITITITITTIINRVHKFYRTVVMLRSAVYNVLIFCSVKVCGMSSSVQKHGAVLHSLPCNMLSCIVSDERCCTLLRMLCCACHVTFHCVKCLVVVDVVVVVVVVVVQWTVLCCATVYYNVLCCAVLYSDAIVC